MIDTSSVTLSLQQGAAVGVRGLGSKHGVPSAAAVALMMVAWAGPAAAWTGVVDWPTFFRTGPGKHFVVIQELARGSAVEVQSCSNHWCLVQIGRVAGYVDQFNLNPQAPPSVFAAPAAHAEGCFDSRRAGYQDGEMFRYCPR